MKILLQNTANGLIPLYGSDFDAKRKLKLGETYEADIKRPRNLGYHRRFFALLNVGHENTKLDLPFEVYRKYVVMKAGFVKIYETPKGNMYEAESISFANMPEDVFQDLYSRVLDVIIKDIGSTSEEIERALIDFV